MTIKVFCYFFYVTLKLFYINAFIFLYELILMHFLVTLYFKVSLLHVLHVLTI